MVAPGRAPLAGLVEVDETVIPWRAKDEPLGPGRRSPRGKRRLAGAVESRAAGPGSPRHHRRLLRRQPARLPPRPSRAGRPGQGWSAYPGTPDLTHDPHSIGPMAAHPVLPWVHRLFANLERWALGVHHGLRRRHLQADLDELVFRCHRRRNRHAAFPARLGIALATKPLTYKMLIAPEPAG